MYYAGLFVADVMKAFVTVDHSVLLSRYVSGMSRTWQDALSVRKSKVSSVTSCCVAQHSSGFGPTSTFVLVNNL